MLVLSYLRHQLYEIWNRIQCCLSKKAVFFNLKVVFQLRKRLSTLFTFKDKLNKMLRSNLVEQFKGSICNDTYYGKTKRYFCLRHMKNKGVRQSHALPRNSEAIDVWKVARHPRSRPVVLWLSLLEHLSFLYFTMRHGNYNQIKIKRILERVPPRKNMSNVSQNLFYVLIMIS